MGAAVGACAIALAGVTWRLTHLDGWRAEIPAYWVWTCGLVALAFVDARTHRLPRRMVWPIGLATAALLTVGSLVHGTPDRLRWAVAGAAVALAAMWALHAASRNGLGFGDVRLAPVIGGPLAYLGVGTMVVWACLAFGLGALGGLIGVARGRLTLRSKIAFGPYLCAGAIIAVVITG